MSVPAPRPRPDRAAPDSSDLGGFGYRQQLRRNVGPFASFAAGFSFVSILTTVFQLFGLGFGFGGAGFFWTWPTVFASAARGPLLRGTGGALPDLGCGVPVVQPARRHRRRVVHRLDHGRRSGPHGRHRRHRPAGRAADDLVGFPTRRRSGADSSPVSGHGGPERRRPRGPAARRDHGRSTPSACGSWPSSRPRVSSSRSFGGRRPRRGAVQPRRTQPRRRDDQHRCGGGELPRACGSPARSWRPTSWWVSTPPGNCPRRPAPRAPRRPRTILRALVVSGVGGALLLVGGVVAAPASRTVRSPPGARRVLTARLGDVGAVAAGRRPSPSSSARSPSRRRGSRMVYSMPGSGRSRSRPSSAAGLGPHRDPIGAAVLVGVGAAIALAVNWDQSAVFTALASLCIAMLYLAYLGVTLPLLVRRLRGNSPRAPTSSAVRCSPWVDGASP